MRFSFSLAVRKLVAAAQRASDAAASPGHGLARACLSAVLTAVICAGWTPANAAPLYRYTYSGVPFGEATIGGHSEDGSFDDPGAESFISAEIVSPYRLSSSNEDLTLRPEIQFSMSDGPRTFVLARGKPLPYHLMPATGFLFLTSFNSAGLPDIWHMQLAWSDGGDGRGFQNAYIDSFLAPDFGHGDVSVHNQWPHGASPVGFVYEQPGTWRLQVMNVPEPASLLLAGMVLVLGWFGRRAFPAAPPGTAAL